MISEPIITWKNLRDVLMGWRRGQIAPKAWLSLTLAEDPMASTPYQRDVILYDTVHYSVKTQLASCRKLSCRNGLYHDTDNLEDILRVFAEDMRADPASVPELKLWSTVYYRYVIPITVPVEVLSACGGISTRTFRRYGKEGLQMLSHRLLYKELSKRREMTS